MAWKNPEDRRAYQRRYYRMRLAKLKELLGNQCAHCGYDEVVEILEFAHKHEEDKSFSVATHLERAWDLVVEEAQKCLLLCPNCHRLYDLDLPKERRID